MTLVLRYRSDLKKSANQQPDELQAYKSINTGHHIVHHDADAAVQVIVEPGYRERLPDVEDPEQDKAQ